MTACGQGGAHVHGICREELCFLSIYKELPAGGPGNGEAEQLVPGQVDGSGNLIGSKGYIFQIFRA